MKTPTSEQMIKTATNSKNPFSPLPFSPFPSLSLFFSLFFLPPLRFSGFSPLNSLPSHLLAPFPLKNSLPLSFSLFFLFIFGSFSPTFSTSHVLRLKTWEGGVMWVCGCVSVWGTLCPPLFFFGLFYFIFYFLFFNFFFFFCIFLFLYFFYFLYIYF